MALCAIVQLCIIAGLFRIEHYKNSRLKIRHLNASFFKSTYKRSLPDYIAPISEIFSILNCKNFTLLLAVYNRFIRCARALYIYEAIVDLRRMNL